MTGSLWPDMTCKSIRKAFMIDQQASMKGTTILMVMTIVPNIESEPTIAMKRIGVVIITVKNAEAIAHFLLLLAFLLSHHSP